MQSAYTPLTSNDTPINKIKEPAHQTMSDEKAVGSILLFDCILCCCPTNLCNNACSCCDSSYGASRSSGCDVCCNTLAYCCSEDCCKALNCNGCICSDDCCADCCKFCC